MKLTSPHSAEASGSDIGKLCDLLLQIVGKNTGRMQTARRHVEVLDAAIPHMPLPQRAEARRRIARLETKWGRLLAGDGEINCTAAGTWETAPEKMIALWLSTRKSPERLLEIVYEAATAVSGGCTNLSQIMEHAYANEVDRVVHLVGYDSFREWLIELRVAKRDGKAVYVPGDFCSWWVENMEPTRRKDTAYAACLQMLMSMKAARFASGSR